MNSIGVKNLLVRNVFHKRVHILLNKERTYVACGCGNVFQKDPYDGRKQRLLRTKLPSNGQYELRRNLSIEKWREWRISFMTRHFGEHVLPVKWLTESLEAIHETTGLPWWATITITTVIFKSVLTFPLAVLATKNKNRLLLLNPELQERIQSLRHEVEVFGHHTGLNKEYDKMIMFYKQKKRLKRKFYVEKNVHPMKSFASVFTQLPLWVYLSFALRHLSGGFLMENVDVRVIKSPGMLTEGTLWFTDLTVPDPTLLLPIIMCVTNLTNIQLMVWDAKSQGMKPALIGRIFVAAGRFFSVMIIPLGTIVPSALVLYWTVSAFYALIQNIALRNERVMLALGIPILPKKPPPPNIVGSYPPKKKKTKGSKTKDNNKDEDIKEERSS